MKIKPLIKTHWLASQNPMMVPLAGLKRVVFCPPWEILEGSFNGHSDLAQDLPPASAVQLLTPDTQEVRETMVRSHTLSRDLFWTTFSGHDLMALRVPPKELRQIARSLEFHFDGGECLSLIGIFRRAGLPTFLDPKFYLLDRSTNWDKVLSAEGDAFMKPLKILDYQKRHTDFKRAWFTVLEIIAWSLQRQRQVGDLEVLWCDGRQTHGPREAFPLSEVEFLKPRPLAATVMCEPGVRNSARMTVFQATEEKGAPGVLRLHAAGLVEEMSPELLPYVAARPEEIQLLEKKTSSTDWEAKLVTVESEPREVLRSMQRLEHNLGKDNVYFVNHVAVTPEALNPRIKIRESEGSMQMSVRFMIESMGVQHANFPYSLAPALKAFWGGIDHYFGIDRKDVASRKKQYRNNDMTFLRHQGLALFILLELINWRLGRPLSSGAMIDYVDDTDLPEFDPQLEKFLKYLKDSIPGLIGKTGTPFEELISQEVKNYFYDYVEKILHALKQDRSFVFFENQVGELKNVQSKVLPLIRFLILHFTEESRGKFLTRAQAPISERFQQSLRQWTEPRITGIGAVSFGSDPFWVDIGLYDKYLIPLMFDLSDHGVDIEFNDAPFLSQENPFEFVFQLGASEIKEDSNWFDLHPQIFFNGERVLPEEVKLNFTPDQIGFIEYRGQIYRIDKKQLPTLKSLQRFWNRIRAGEKQVRHNSFGEQIFKLPKSQALELLMLKHQGIQVEAHGEWKKIFDYYEHGLGTEKIKLPEIMETNLLPHQKEGTQWLHDLYELRLGAILADEMGLGKTFQVLAFLTSLMDRLELKKTLIVVPTSLVYNWVDEKNKFATDLPLQVFNSHEQERMGEVMTSKAPLVMVTTYGLLTEYAELFSSVEWNVVAFDEAQNLKNITSQRSIAARGLTANFKVCLTGTPMENNYLEFFSLCDLVVPGSLGDVDAFRKRYYNQEVRAEAIKDLRLISRPLLLRRTKAQVKLSLPVKTLQKVLLPFEEKQKEIYKKMAMTFSRQVEVLVEEQGQNKAQIAMFAALMRLRQICSDPAAVPGVSYEDLPVKVEHFLDSLVEHLENDESVIVFTQFLTTLGRIEGELKKRNIPVHTLQGSISAKERLRIISAFQESKAPAVMLMTLKTGGVGLNLTKASVVYHLEPWWNPAVENQATDRAHRMGQTKDVKVYNLLIEGSLEERIADLKVKKQDSFDRLFANEENPDEAPEQTSGLTKEDFMYLLK